MVVINASDQQQILKLTPEVNNSRIEMSNVLGNERYPITNDIITISMPPFSCVWLI